MSIFTYGGQVIVGVEGDATVLSDPKLITEKFRNAVNEMGRCFLRTTDNV